MSVRAATSLLDHFSGLTDPRQGWRVIYPLREVLLLVLCASLCGMDDFVEIRMWGDQLYKFLFDLTDGKNWPARFHAATVCAFS